MHKFTCVCVLVSLFSVSYATVTLSSNKQLYTYGENLTVSYSVTSGYNDGDWIALFSNSSTDNGDYISYEYVDSAASNPPFSSSITFQGIYQSGFFLFKYLNGSNSEIAISSTFQITTFSPFLSAPPTVLLGQRIPVQITTSAYHSDSDWIGMFSAGTCTDSNDCYLAYVYVPSGAYSTVYFDGIDQSTTTVEFRYLLNDNTALSSASTQIIASSNITQPSFIIDSVTNFISFTSSPFHSLGDWIGVFAVGSCPNNECYYGYSYVPEGSSGTVLIPIYTGEILSSNSRVELRYILPSSQTVFTSSPIPIYSTVGTCGSTCGNSGVNCHFDSDCTSCTNSFCEPSEGPTFQGATPNDGDAFNTLVETPISFVVQARGVGQINIKFQGIPTDASVSFNQSTNYTEARVTWTPSEEYTSSYFYVCFVAVGSTLIPSDLRCININVKGTSCSSWGDPHLNTFDGLSYDFQAVGDFYLAKKIDGSSFAIQGRFESCSEDSQVTCNRAIALKSSSHRLEVYFYDGVVPEVYVNSIAQSLTSNITLPDGSEVETVDNGGSYDFIVRLVNKVRVKIESAGSNYPTVTVTFPGSWVSTVTGLCGNFNADPSDDFRTSNGTFISDTSSLADVYYLFGTSWRILESDSFFNYSRIGGSYDEVNNLTYVPAFSATFSSQTLQEQATALCNSFGFPNNYVTACLFDIASTNDLAAADSTVTSYQTRCLQSSLGSCSVSQCSNYCNYHGICNSAHVCTCFSGWISSDCSQPAAVTSSTTTGVSSTGQTEVSSVNILKPLMFLLIVGLIL